MSCTEDTRIIQARLPPGQIRAAITYRLESLLPGETLTVSVCTLENNAELHSMTVLRVPRGRYVWVASGRSQVKDSPSYEYIGVASDVVDSPALPLPLDRPAAVDIETFKVYALQQNWSPNDMDVSRYIQAVQQLVTPGNVNMLHWEFMINSSFFTGQRGQEWYVAIPKLAIVNALLRGKVIYSVPKIDRIVREGPEKASTKLKALRSSLLSMIRRSENDE